MGEQEERKKADVAEPEHGRKRKLKGRNAVMETIEEDSELKNEKPKRELSADTRKEEERQRGAYEVGRILVENDMLCRECGEGTGGHLRRRHQSAH